MNHQRKHCIDFIYIFLKQINELMIKSTLLLKDNLIFVNVHHRYIIDKRNNHASRLNLKFESELIRNISYRPRVFDTQPQDIIARICFKKTI